MPSAIPDTAVAGSQDQARPRQATAFNFNMTSPLPDSAATGSQGSVQPLQPKVFKSGMDLNVPNVFGEDWRERNGTVESKVLGKRRAHDLSDDSDSGDDGNDGLPLQTSDEQEPAAFEDTIPYSELVYPVSLLLRKGGSLRGTHLRKQLMNPSAFKYSLISTNPKHKFANRQVHTAWRYVFEQRWALIFPQLDLACFQLERKYRRDPDPQKILEETKDWVMAWIEDHLPLKLTTKKNTSFKWAANAAALRKLEEDKQKGIERPNKEQEMMNLKMESLEMHLDDASINVNEKAKFKPSNASTRTGFKLEIGKKDLPERKKARMETRATLDHYSPPPRPRQRKLHHGKSVSAVKTDPKTTQTADVVTVHALPVSREGEQFIRENDALNYLQYKSTALAPLSYNEWVRSEYQAGRGTAAFRKGDTVVFKENNAGNRWKITPYMSLDHQIGAESRRSKRRAGMGAEGGPAGDSSMEVDKSQKGDDGAGVDVTMEDDEQRKARKMAAVEEYRKTK